MDAVLKDLVGTECCVFINDVVIFSSIADEHAVGLENVLRRFVEANLQLHPGNVFSPNPRNSTWDMCYQREEFQPPLIK